MRRFAIGLLALGFAATLATSADAGALSALPANGQLTQLEDDDWEILVNSGGTIAAPRPLGTDGTVDEGDFFVGMIRISNVQQPLGTIVRDFDENGGETFSAVFAAKVATKSGSFTFTFEPLSDPEWLAVGLDGLGFNRQSSDTLAIVFDDPDNIAPETGAAKDGNVSDDLQTVDGTRLWEFGHPAANGDLFFAASTPAGGSDDVDDAGLGTFLTINGAMDVTHTYAAAGGLILLPLDISLLVPGAPGTAQVLVNGSASGPGDTDFDVATDTDFFIAAVPEPTSLTLVALGGLGMLGAGYRRRRATAKKKMGA